MNNVWCPKCKQIRLGNYCSECGLPLEHMPRKKIPCPCCQGTGQIEEFGPQWGRWMVSEPKALINSPGLRDLINENVMKLSEEQTMWDFKLSQ